MGGAVMTVFEGSADRVFQAALESVPSLRFRIIRADPGTRTVSFNTGMSWRSWAGQNVTVVVSPEGDERATVSVSGSRVQVDHQVFDWGELGSIRRRFLKRLSELLPTIAEPTETTPGDETADGVTGIAD